MAKAKRAGKASSRISRKQNSSAARKATATRAKAKAPAARGTRFGSCAIGVTVDDISASMSWYCDVLGFSVRQRWEQNGTLMGGELAAGDALIYLGQDDWKKGRDRAKGDGVRIYFYVKFSKDVDRLAAEIKNRGGSLASEPQDMWGVRSFELVDPTGYTITISSGE